MRINSKGQVTILKAIREQLGFLPHTEVEFVPDGDGARLVKAHAQTSESQGELAVRLLRGAGPLAMGTDEILTLTRGE